MDPFVEIGSQSPHNQAGRFGTVIRGFKRYDTDPGAVGADKIHLVADFIKDSLTLPGAAPATRIIIVGHADTDARHDLEQQKSDDRARNTEQALRRETEFLFFPRKMPAPWGQIKWEVSGVGATEPDPENIKRKKSSPVVTEEDRKRNRRVEVVVVTSALAPPPIKIFLTDDDVRKILEGMRQPIIPGPPPPPLRPTPQQVDPRIFAPLPPPIPSTSKLKEFIKKAQDKLSLKLGDDWVGKVDPGPIFKSLKDAIITPAPPTFQDFVKEWQDQENERRNRQINPPEREPQQPGL